MKHKTRKKRIVRRKRRVMRRKIPLRTARAMVLAGLPLRRSELRGNPKKELVLWGYHPKPGYGLTAPMRLAEYRSQKQQNIYNKEGWTTGVYAKGEEPVGLRLQVAEMRRSLAGNRRRGLRRNPARTNKAHFGYAKIGMELLGTGLKIKKGERVYMTPATNIPGGGFFVEPAYRTGLWKQGSADDAILIAPKDFDDEITYVEPRGEYRPTPQVKPDYKYGIYTGRGIARNPRLGKEEKKALDFARKYPNWNGYHPDRVTSRVMRSLAKKKLIELSSYPNQFRAIQKNPPMRSFASLHPRDKAKLNKFLDYVYSFYGKGGVYARDFKNGGFNRKTIEGAIMVYIDDIRKGKVKWGDGDSIDRERVRTILDPGYSMFIPIGATILRPNRRMRRK